MKEETLKILLETVCNGRKRYSDFLKAKNLPPNLTESLISQNPWGWGCNSCLKSKLDYPGFIFENETIKKCQCRKTIEKIFKRLDPIGKLKARKQLRIHSS